MNDILPNGVLPVKKDHRDYSATRTFGAIMPVFADSYSCDAGFRMPDQNAEGLSQGCTGYTQSELCQDEDDIPFQPRYTYDKTLFMEGSKEGEPCQIRNSLKSTSLWGVLPNSTTLRDTAISFMQVEDDIAGKYKRAAYFVVERNKGLDWFDSMRNMLVAGSAVEHSTGRAANRSISVASSWYREWSGIQVNSTGIVSVPANWQWMSGHNWKISGWKTLNGTPYLMGKTWQGKLFGDNGWAYFSREIINKLMEQPGSSAFMLFRSDSLNPEDVKLVKLTWLDWLKSYMRLLALKLR